MWAVPAAYLQNVASARCAPTGCGQRQMCASKSRPKRGLFRLPLNCCKIHEVQRSGCCRGDVSRCLSSSTTIFPEGTLAFWFKNLVSREGGCRGVCLARSTPWEPRTSHPGYPGGRAAGETERWQNTGQRNYTSSFFCRVSELENTLAKCNFSRLPYLCLPTSESGACRAGPRGVPRRHSAVPGRPEHSARVSITSPAGSGGLKPRVTFWHAKSSVPGNALVPR